MGLWLPQGREKGGCREKKQAGEDEVVAAGKAC